MAKTLKRRKGESKEDFKARKARVMAKRAEREAAQEAPAVSDEGLPIHPTLNVPFVRRTDNDIMTKEDAAAFLGVSQTTLAAYARRGEIKSLIDPNQRNRKSPSRVYYRPHLEEFKANQQVYILFTPDTSPTELEETNISENPVASVAVVDNDAEEEGVYAE